MNRHFFTALVLGILSSALAEGQERAEGKVRVYVEAGTDEDGWAVKELTDSAKDLRGEMGNKWCERVDSEEEADMKVTVTNRYHQGTGVIVSDYNPYTQTASAGEQNVKIVTARITVMANDKTKDIYGWDKLFWKNAARGLENVVENFVKANYEKIVALRKKPEGDKSRDPAASTN